MKFSLNTSTASALHLNRNLSAPREALFRAFTDAALLSDWWSEGKGKAALEPKLNGKVSLGGSAGTVRAITKPELFVFSLGGEGPKKDQETLITVEFRKGSAGTTLSVTHEGLPDAAAQERHRVAWVARLDRLGKLVSDDTK